MQFKKAVKYDAKARVALIAPAGGGKTFTMLTLARALAGTGRIACLDTEHGSMSKYADLFDFDVIELDSFSPDNFMGALDAAERAQYAVFCVDSLSHFWVGKDGALEFVDMAAKRHKDQMGGWKDFRPHERAMVDRMVASPCHVIATMRAKTAYEEEVDPKTGKKKRVKVGLAPVQREGLEYEFDLVGYMDPDDNTFVVDKTRCPAYSQKAFTKPGAKEFQPFIDWLAGAKREQAAAPTPPAATPAAAQTSSTQADTKPGVMLPGVLADHLAAIEVAPDMQVLRSAFTTAFRAAEAAGDVSAQRRLEVAKDLRKGQLQPQPALV